MRYVGDTDVIYGIAQGRDQEGNLTNIQIGMAYEQALAAFDQHPGAVTAILQFKVSVLASVDIERNHNGEAS